MSSRIEQLIDEIEIFIDNCKYQPLSKTNIIVNKEEIDELIRELRARTPDEIKRYQKIINNKDAILEDARQKAKALISEAEAHTNELISDHEIMQQAYAQANDVISSAAKQAQSLLEHATSEANAMRAASVQYMDQLLSEFEQILNNAIDTTNMSYETLLTEFAKYSETVKSNRTELHQPRVTQPAPAAERKDEGPEPIAG